MWNVMKKTLEELLREIVLHQIWWEIPQATIRTYINNKKLYEDEAGIQDFKT